MVTIDDVPLPPPPENDLLPPGVDSSPEWVADTANGIYYRRVTLHEAKNNNWPWKSLLVVAPDLVADVTQGRGTAELVLPIAPHPYSPIEQALPTIEFDLKRRGSHNLASFIKVRVPARGRKVSTVSRPRFYFYVPVEIEGPGPFDQIVTLWGDDKGGVVAHGAMADREFDLRGPYKAKPGGIELEVPPPVGNSVFLLTTGFGSPTSFAVSGPREQMLLASHGGALEVDAEFSDFTTAPDSMAADAHVGQCDDGLDNDGDGFADRCDFACMPHRDFNADSYDEVREWEFRKEFGLFADGRLCTENPDAFQGILNSIAMEGSSLLNQIEVPPEFGPDLHPVPPFQFVLSGCYEFDSFAEADDCHTYGACVGNHASYPLSGVGNDYANYLPGVWPLVEHFVNEYDTEGQPVAPISIAVVATSVQAFGIAGKASTPPNALWAENWQAAGRAVIWVHPAEIEDDEYGSSGKRLAHEIGHTLGLEHDTVSYRGDAGFMDGQGYGTAPIVDWDAPSTMSDATQFDAWSRGARKYWPRWSGFVFTECENNGDCAPGLACHPEWGKVCFPP